MAPSGRRFGVALAKERLTTDALLVRLVPYRDADAIVHLFTEQAGAVSAMARGARRSKRRFTSLEPMHTLRATVDLAAGRELGTLIDTAMVRPRIALTSSLRAMEAAGRALRWLRKAAPARIAEPALWEHTIALLDSLEEVDSSQPDAVDALLAGAGVRMLAASGWQLELGRCVRCEKPAPARARTVIDVRAGGVVCQDCGATGVTISSAQRRAMIVAVDGGALDADAAAAVSIVEQAFEAHGRGAAT